jgi:2-hydroxychromene-2-carboxylate isomerase
MSPRDRIRRRAMPRIVVALSTVHAHRRLAARVRRVLGGQAVVRVYVAFDDPSSAVALLGLAERIEHRRVRLLVEPVVRRGIPDDPAADAKRRYAMVDSSRLARRSELELSRSEPLAASDTAFLAEWAASLPAAARLGFCAAAMRRVWFESDGAIRSEDFQELWREYGGNGVPSSGKALAGEQQMKRRRLYDTPVAVVHGQWHFAHERLAAIDRWLDELGWTASP